MSFSIVALHIGLEDENKKSPPPFPNSLNLKPLPSSMFFLTLSFALTGFFLASEYLYNPQELKVDKMHSKINRFFIIFFWNRGNNSIFTEIKAEFTICDKKATHNKKIH